MENFVKLSLLSYSLFWFLNNSTLTETLRKVLKVNEASTWYQKLYTCPYCLCYHFGWIFLLIQDYGMWSFLLAFIIALLSYFLSLIEKVLKKHILF